MQAVGGPDRQPNRVKQPKGDPVEAQTQQWVGDQGNKWTQSKWYQMSSKTAQQK